LTDHNTYVNEMERRMTVSIESQKAVSAQTGGGGRFLVTDDRSITKMAQVFVTANSESGELRRRWSPPLHGGSDTPDVRHVAPAPPGCLRGEIRDRRPRGMTDANVGAAPPRQSAPGFGFSGTRRVWCGSVARRTNFLTSPRNSTSMSLSPKDKCSIPITLKTFER
jgi:hypothetical protein